MTVAELKATESIAQIPRLLGDLNQKLDRIANAMERHNWLIEKQMNPIFRPSPSLPPLPSHPTAPTVPSNYTTPSPAPIAMPSEVESFTGEPLTR